MARPKRVVEEIENEGEITAEAVEAERQRLSELESKQSMNKRTFKAEKHEGIRGISGADQIKVICVRRIGLDDGTSDVGEEISIPKEIAAKLQDVGAIKVKL